MRAIPSILAVAVTAAGLAGATYGVFDHEWKAVLAPVSGSKITGEAELEGKDKDKSSKAEISIKGRRGCELHRGTFTPGSVAAAAARRRPEGVCATQVGKDGDARAKRNCHRNTGVGRLSSTCTSRREIRTIVSCGDLALRRRKAESSGSGY
jgi:hypothetical protein